MEWKIGEIRQVNGEWYQCVEESTCEGCLFNMQNCCNKVAETFGECYFISRSDEKDVIFRKLEKVGDPYLAHDHSRNKDVVVQDYKLYNQHACYNGHEKMMSFGFRGRNEIVTIKSKEPIKTLNCENSVEIQIEQTKEDMEEKKLIELLSEKVHNAWMKEKEAQGFSYGKDYDREKKKHPDMLPYNELKEEVKEYDRATVRAVLQAQKELQSKYNYNNLKSFDIEAAKVGKPVCTRDGRKARIICFDRRDEFSHIVALITNLDGREIIWGYEDSGACSNDNKNNDLMMLPEKKEGWVNIYALNTCYSSKEEAEANIDQDYEHEYVRTVKIEWEE